MLSGSALLLWLLTYSAQQYTRTHVWWCRAIMLTSHLSPCQLLATFVIQYERLRGVQSSGVLFLFWFLSVLCAIVPFRSKILQISLKVKHHKTATVKSIVFSVFFICFTAHVTMCSSEVFFMSLIIWRCCCLFFSFLTPPPPYSTLSLLSTSLFISYSVKRALLHWSLREDVSLLRENSGGVLPKSCLRPAYLTFWGHISTIKKSLHGTTVLGLMFLYRMPS